jgi:hypothetical protein
MTPPRNDIRNDIKTAACPVCADTFTPTRRQRYCTPACRQAAWRARHPTARPAIVVPARTRRRDITVYHAQNATPATSASNTVDRTHSGGHRGWSPDSSGGSEMGSTRRSLLRNTSRKPLTSSSMAVVRSPRLPGTSGLIGSQGRRSRVAVLVPHPPFNPYVRFSRIRLTDGLLCMVTLPSGNG